MTTKDPNCVYRAQGEFEAQQMKALLHANGIPSTFRGEALRNTHGLTLDGLGVVDVLVSDEHLAAAKDVVERATRGEFELEEKDIPPAD